MSPCPKLKHCRFQWITLFCFHTPPLHPKTNHRIFVPFNATLQSRLLWSSSQPSLPAANSSWSRIADGSAWATSLAWNDVLFAPQLLPWCLHTGELSRVMLSKRTAVLSPSMRGDKIMEEHLHGPAGFPLLICQPLVLTLRFVLSADYLGWWSTALLPLASITLLHACTKMFILPLVLRFSQEPGRNFPMFTFSLFFPCLFLAAAERWIIKYQVIVEVLKIETQEKVASTQLCNLPTD